MLKINKIITTIILALGLVLPTKAGEFGKIVGQVVDDSTGKPLSGVNVIVEGTEYGASTDEEGNYYIFFIPPGTYQVTAGVGYLGYQKKTQTDVVVTANQTTRLDFRLKPAKIDTVPLIKVGLVFTYPPADTTLPERYVRKKLFELNWGKEPGGIGVLPNGSGPGGLAVDDSGNIHILANMGPGQLRIVVFDSTGRFLYDTDINYERKKIMETNLGYDPGFFNCLGIDSQGNYLIGPTIDAHLYTFDRNGNYVRKDTTDMRLGANLLCNSKVFRLLKRNPLKMIKGDTVIIPLSNIETNESVMQLKIYPKEWILYTSDPDFEILNLDKNGNRYILVIAFAKKNENEELHYIMVNKYDKNGQLLTEIPLKSERCEEARVYVTTNGEIYVLTYYTRCILPDGRYDYPAKKPFVSKWVFESKRGEK